MKNISVRNKIWTGLFAVLMSLGMILGHAYNKANTASVIWRDTKSIMVNAILFIVLTICLYIGICLLYHGIDHMSIVNNNSKYSFGRYYIEKLQKRPIVVSFVTLLIVYIPYILCHYPIVLMGDSYDQILQGFNIPAYTSETIQLISEDVTLNGHHPVAHTLLLHFFLVVGKKIYSYNLGAFLYAMFNMVLLFLVISVSIKILIKKHVKSRWIILLLAYFVLTPHMQEYMFLCTKDTWFAVLLMLFYILLFDFDKMLNEKKRYICLVLTSIGIVLFRNEGKYFIILTLAIIFVLSKRYRKKCLVVVSSVIVFSLFYTSVLLPMNQITPGSTREMLSIPFQQTARYVKEHENEVTELEQESISKILDYDHLAELYSPNSADSVKASYNKYADKQDLKDYFATWLKMGIKHPKTYIQAFLNNKYQFIYPVFDTAQYYNYQNKEFYDLTYSTEMMESVNTSGESVGLDLHYPKKFSNLRYFYEEFLENAWDYPVLSCFKTTAIYVWVILMWCMYAITRKHKKSFLCCIPILVQLLICMAGPVNGYYFRYMYPLAYCLPMVLLLCKAEYGGEK